VSRLTQVQIGLEAILETLEMRFEYDALGRIVGTKHAGVTPRFVLGRSAEGCVWRFAADLEVHLIQRVAKLAGREPGFPSDRGSHYPPPERLVMIERILDAAANREGNCPKKDTLREDVTREGVTIGEIWTVE
jgi:hypothetical protein